MNIAYTSRFSSTDWFGENRIITIGGAGTIGTWVSLLLARTGEHTLIIFDDDIVEIHNMAGQLFRKSDIGTLKVDAIKDIILSFTDHSENTILTSNSRITDKSKVTPVCISCFDSMKARKDMFTTWCKLDNREIFIDGRMSVESYEIYTVLKGEEDSYLETLFEDDTVPAQICSLKSTSHVGAMIGSKMTAILMNYLANINISMTIREIPFMIREDLELMNYTNGKLSDYIQVYQ
jgi:molybdopterin/thiamine biosynthesis adenylyltransferase